MYLMNGSCRVCALSSDKTVADLDKDLLEGMDINTILYKYSGKFSDPTLPLTRTSLYAHRKHLRRSIPSAILQIPELTNPLSKKSQTDFASPARSEGFDSFLGTVEKDRELLDVLVESAMTDLISSDALISEDVKDNALVLSVRNTIRKALSEFIALSKEMANPSLPINVGDTNKKLFVEFLLIVKKAAELSIRDEKVLENFLLEITCQLRKSKEFKSVLEEESDRRGIMDMVNKETST